MDKLGQVALELQALIKPITASIIAEIKPKEDRISTNEAYKRYSRCWIEKQIKRNNLKVTPRGNKKEVSVKDIEAILAVEELQARAKFKA